jgi:sialic acid synthase SpsE
MGVIFVAEIGMNCDGNFDLNYELIRQAKWAGADIAKFQVGWREGKGEINYMNEERIHLLKKWCNQFDIEFMASVFTLEAFELIKKIGVKRYKVASRTVIDDIDLCECIIEDGKEVFISLGMWNNKELPFNRENVKYLYCKSVYPTRYYDLMSFPDNFDKYYGYSDHLMGIEGCLLAISRGAKLIEKHFTLNKTSSVIRDHSLSATPEEFRIMTNYGKDINNLLEHMPK